MRPVRRWEATGRRMEEDLEGDGANIDWRRFWTIGWRVDERISLATEVSSPRGKGCHGSTQCPVVRPTHL